MTADPVETYKNFSEDGRGKLFHPETSSVSKIYASVRVVLH